MSSSEAQTVARAQGLALQATCTFCVLEPQPEGGVPANIVRGRDNRFICSTCGRHSWEIPGGASAIYHQDPLVRSLLAHLCSATKPAEFAAVVNEVKGGGANQRPAGHESAGARRLGLGLFGVARGTGGPATAPAITEIRLTVPGTRDQVHIQVRYAQADLPAARESSLTPQVVASESAINTVTACQLISRLSLLGYALVTFETEGLKQRFLLVKGQPLGPELYAGIHVQVQSEPF